MPHHRDHLSVFLAYKSRLHGLAYKMTERVSDAEDILSDVYLSFSNQPIEQIQEPEKYLVRAVIHGCLAVLNKQQRLSYPGINLPEPIVYERFPDLQQNDVSYALLVLLQKLNAVERAVFLLRESFDYHYDEIATLLGISQDNCRQQLHRAKEKLRTGKARYIPSQKDKEEMTQAFLTACATGDVKWLEAYLSKEVTIFADGGGKAIAAVRPVAGQASVISYLLGIANKFGSNLSYAIKQVNLETGVLLENSLTVQLDTVMILTFDDHLRISEVYLIRNPDKMKFLA
ncbi:MAG: sigma-70 family RNA polymerase sigma factor [Chitinophaga sp.]|uniref:sigma-70 family RNA polymerase sigma factor n=1 Tax=Chitinophaga sp. TaxID=1869181 RepID=UPI001B1C931C|nr:sigma-70 family RNA polymerase sigma factor [Chitinophaga sp.]MBO9733013.1 sigma-70 family RNA polymerase sigma factor [Chitinophaga sp.]